MTITFTERIAQLGPAQRELLERRLDTPPGAGHPLVRSEPVSGGRHASPTQRSMWFVHHLDPMSSVFNNGNAVRVRGPLDIAALSNAMTELIRRHEILRTTYRLVDGELLQFIQPPPGDVLEVREASQQPAVISAQLRHEIETEAARPFDLEKDLMYRGVLYRLAEGDHILVRSGHHIAFDRWSVALANREISELYRARVAGQVPELPDLPVQYADFARWQLERLDADKDEARLRFFTSHIAGVPDHVDMPTDHPTSHAQGPAATLRRPMADDVASKVRTAARDLGATPFMVLLAAYGVLMSRYTRSDQLLVGVPVALRTEPELSQMIGPFINTVVLRLDLRGGPTFGELVARVCRVSLNMIAHQDLPFDELVREVAPDRVASRTPLFQIMFDYLNTPHSELDLEGLDLEATPLEPKNTAHDLTLYVEDQPSGIVSRWEYRADIFDRPTIGALAAGYDTLVRRLIEEPARQVDEIGMLEPADEKRVRAMGSGPTVTVRDNVLEMLEQQRRRSPDRPAVESGDATYSYDRLAALSRRAAVSLRSRGVQPGDKVALLATRSVDLVAGLVSVMMAGGTAVLLDRDQPPPRLLAMLDISQPALALVDADNLGDIGSTPAVTIESLFEGDPSSDDSPSFAPLVPIETNDPAYVVFTSGSTGRPKGVVIAHGSLANFVDAARSAYDLQDTDRILQFASPGFDTMLEEVFPTLSVGATVVMRPAELFSSFETFEQFSEDRGITVLDLPTAWWHSWVDDLDGSGRSLPNGLRMVIVGGEAARTNVWRAWKRLAGDTRWVNSYGPSEGTVVVSTFEPDPAFEPAGQVMPIGRPIQNTVLLTVDPTGLPVPPRVSGELVIEGAAVALGYLEGGEATVFPESAISELRRYSTGDRARLLPDATLEFIGRLDSQFKVRGTRVEPAEVERALRTHPLITDAVAVPDAGSGLVAHIIPADSDIDTTQVRDYLTTRLPAPMIPATWRIHETLPTTPGGKVDRQTLMQQAAPPSAIQRSRVAPRSDNEAKLAEIWESVLGTSAISVRDSFFDLGGHSLLGVKLLSQVSTSLGIDLPLRVIFETPTIESMARLLENPHA